MQVIATLSLVLAFVAPTAAAAADPPPALADAPFARADRASLDSPLDLDCRALRCERHRPHQRMRFGAAPGLGATLVEFRSQPLPGMPERSHHGLGVRSHRLESALNEIGIEARHCLAPVVRMHTKLSSSFDLSGTLWVYLRCSVE